MTSFCLPLYFIIITNIFQYFFYFTNSKSLFVNAGLAMVTSGLAAATGPVFANYAAGAPVPSAPTYVTPTPFPSSAVCNCISFECLLKISLELPTYLCTVVPVPALVLKK